MEEIEVSMPLYEARLSLTGKCNHKCIYCGPFSDGKEVNGYQTLSLLQIRQLVTLLKDKVLHIQLTGGEPTLRKDLIEIVDTLHSGGIKDIGITTNGSRINPEYAKRMLSAGISGVHIHVPSLNFKAFQNTTKSTRIETIDNIVRTALSLQQEGCDVEFNTPVTHMNVSTLSDLMEFCYTNKINLKLIEEIDPTSGQITEAQIIQLFENWFQSKGLHLDESRINKKYGRIYNFGEFSFRVAPATKGFVDFLNHKNKKILYDGRYWIGGDGEEFLFTPSYFLKPQKGNLAELKDNLNQTLHFYLQNNEKK